MTTPEQWLERLEAAERTSTGPPPSSADRIWAGIEGRLDNGPAPPELDHSPLLEQAGEVAVQAASAGSGVAIKLVAAAVLVGLVGGGLALGLRERNERTTEPVAVVDERAPIEPEPVRVVEPVPPKLEPEPEPKPEPKPESVLEPEPIEPPPPSKPSKPKPVEPQPPVAAKTLADEVALMQALSTALKRGDSSDVLALVGEHERDFASGQFLEERRAAKARALCQAGKLAAGQKEAASFAKRWPKSIHLAAVEQDCGIE